MIHGQRYAWGHRSGMDLVFGGQWVIGQEELGITSTSRDGGSDADPDDVPGPSLWDALGFAISPSL